MGRNSKRGSEDTITLIRAQGARSALTDEMDAEGPGWSEASDLRTSGEGFRSESEDFSSLRSRMPAAERALKDFEDMEAQFSSRNLALDSNLEASEVVAAGVRGLVVCRQMARHLRVLEGGRARLESLQEVCAEVLTRYMSQAEMDSSQVMRAEPKTPDSKPEPQNAKPETLNPKPETGGGGTQLAALPEHWRSVRHVRSCGRHAAAA